MVDLVPLSVAIAWKAQGETTELTIGRGKKGKTFRVRTVLHPIPAIAPTWTPRQADPGLGQEPAYFVLGGLVWSVLTEPLYHAAEGYVPSATYTAAFEAWRTKQ